jgi:hypothetical protein
MKNKNFAKFPRKQIDILRSSGKFAWSNKKPEKWGEQ